ncbi:helix-turn-helix domain-containing protein [Microvirga lenta]|uniref:helix-turn-helix domain-containing protein n=1 Tax=Microvirga lenta TaxID=2881337 RepID=UPI001CFF651C|nr:helix-turn-helix domain-containing protein [Microvirga lenta]MCB5174829.1 helix-turn-helix domain-containing protein [Microvirga lenta]
MDNSPDINAHLAARLRSLRAERGLTLDGLAECTGVSRSMISLIERGQSSPTAAVLDKLAAGLGVTLASLFSGGEGADPSPLARRADQRTWRDPATGYMRRNLSAPGYPSPIELVEVVLPAGARVTYDTGPRSVGIGQQVWMIDGDIELTVGDATHRLATGDCLSMHIDQLIVFHNPADRPARYLVALAADRNGTGAGQR